ncbi:MAG: hypothetical protein QXH91_09980 [Candidatus Bathyarchaeia archaeon]
MRRPSISSRKRGYIRIVFDKLLEVRLEKRREELFNHYKDVCGYMELKNLLTGSFEMINIEERKRKLGYRPFLLSLLPKQILNIRHDLPLKILAFSDYRVHSFKPLFEYLKSLDKGERPDLIIYAGDDVERFGPLPIEHLILPLKEGGEYLEAVQGATLKYEAGRLTSPSFGFVL